MTRLLSAFFLLITAALAQVGPIQDNSFLAEEAYNQEPGVVQHISTFTHQSDGTWAYTFTQEWPVPDHWRNQLSYTSSALGASGNAGMGWGDTLINYRYQLIGSGETRVAFAPRASLILPSGSSYWSRGFGGTGAQFALPLSVVLTKNVVSHWDLGVSIIPHATDAAGDHGTLRPWYAAHSFVWLVKPRFNALVETAYFNNETVVSARRTSHSGQLFVSPGVRWAYNLSHGLQIVPGVGVPIGAGPSSGQAGVLLYLSFEHPLWKESEK
ncbi:conserved hypothetical protein [Candidatus Koribacter versatilis Ellin345]|uniref:Transporter n=1 Tax=Koribacter versatilis (strain Ellin345) TaxID=204669 RepID=Q1IUU0_KORVE|nr:hypothetical protein [Candidatus Koribacter versatilis]ABF39360.1 conserved hypothetical protein [Candidatus Koribacter versatilis Ellin345]